MHKTQKDRHQSWHGDCVCIAGGQWWLWNLTYHNLGKPTTHTLLPNQKGCLPYRDQAGCIYILSLFSAMTPKPQEMHIHSLSSLAHTQLWEHQSQAHKTPAKVHPQASPKDRHAPPSIQRSQHFCNVLQSKFKIITKPKRTKLKLCFWALWTYWIQVAM